MSQWCQIQCPSRCCFSYGWKILMDVESITIFHVVNCWTWSREHHGRWSFCGTKYETKRILLYFPSKYEIRTIVVLWRLKPEMWSAHWFMFFVKTSIYETKKMLLYTPTRNIADVVVVLWRLTPTMQNDDWVHWFIGSF